MKSPLTPMLLNERLGMEVITYDGRANLEMEGNVFG